MTVSSTLISTDELRGRLGDPGLTIVDTRPLRAYNGWRLERQRRGGHVPGAVAFPSEWLESVDAIEVERLLESKGIVSEREIVLYGDPAGVSSFERRLTELGHAGVRVYEQGWPAWAADEALPIEHLPRYERLVHPGWLEQVLSGQPAGSGAERSVPALPRQLRSARRVRGEPPPRSALPRHEPAREPGRLEPSLAGGARGRPADARDHPGHDGRPLRTRHRGSCRREMARPPRRTDLGLSRRAHPPLLRRP